ncbi:MAG: GDP-mannose 4,6-dehydratase [Sulfolobales archaeon]
MNILVTGGAGFIGSHLVDSLIDGGYKVFVIDNLSSGRMEYLRKCIENPSMCRYKICDIKDPGCLDNIDLRFDLIYHLAANPDVRASSMNPESNFNENLVATFRVLEFMRKRDVSKIIFTSSSTVYGDAEKIPTPEDHPIKPVSIYGACKASGEIMIQTYSRLYNFSSVILRLANIIGPRSTHGVVYDFIRKLMRNPRELEILGDGSQRKSYLYIDDTIKALKLSAEILERRDPAKNSVYVLNVGNEDWISVRDIADIVINEMGLENVKINYKPATSDGRGWPGDVKLMLLDISRIKSLGWSPRLSSYDAVRLTARSLIRELASL